MSNGRQSEPIVRYAGRMDEAPRKSSLIYGLAALCIVCAAILVGLRTMTGEQFMMVLSLVFGAVGLAHMPSPASTSRIPAAGLALLALAGCSAKLEWFPPGQVVVAARPLLESAPPSLQATSITPITNLSSPSSGLRFSGDAYDVSCTVSGSVTLYPVVHDGTAWEGPYQGYGCALADTISTKGTCTLPARAGVGLIWNAFKTGAGTVSSCTAEGRSGTVPPTARSSGGGGGSGTVTSVGLSAPSEFSVGGSPVTTSGTLALSWANPVTIAHGGTNSTTALSNNRVMVSAAGAIVELSAGTAGQVLTSGGAGVAPSWAAAGSDLSYFFSPVDYAVTQLSGNVTGGNWTGGCTFRPTRTGTIARIRFAWPTTAAATVKVSLWNQAGSRVATTNVSVNATGIYEGTVSVSVGSGDIYQIYTAGFYIIGGVDYVTYPFASYPLTSNPYVASPSIVMIANNLFSMGDVQPTGIFSEWAAIEPIME